MRRPDHGTYIEWLHAELDGELSPRDRAALERHLSSCAECRAERRELGDLDQLLAASRIPVRQGFRDDVMAALPAAGWEARHRKSWVMGLLLIALLGGGAAALVGASAARLEPAVPFLAAVAAVFEMIRSSLLAGAGLLGASWQGLGLAVGRLLNTSIWNLVAFGILVLAVDYLLLRLVLGRSRPARAAASRDTARSSSHNES